MAALKWLITGASVAVFATVLHKESALVFSLGTVGAGVGGFIVGNIVEDVGGWN